MPEKPRNVGASVRQRLLNLARASGQPLELLLTRYALERLLHRLSISPHRHRFVLKGALLLTTWFEAPHRATRDLDLLGFGDPSDDALLTVFREIMAHTVDDGVSFDTAGLQIQPIREDLEYGGSRLRTTAALAGARIPIVVDVGFGDAIEPSAEDIDLPVLIEELHQEMKNLFKPGQQLVYAHEGDRNAQLDGRLLKNILINLVSNAIKYSPEQSIIQVNSHIGSDNIRISVRDHGVGIPEPDQKHLFGRFFRASNATNIQGTGLGLYIVQRYAEMMNGEVGFSSAVEEGSEFWVKFMK